jgi:hypothetical protein
MRGAQTRDGLHAAEDVVEHVTPMTKHVENEAAAVFLAVVPRLALRWNRVTLKDPVTELAAHRGRMDREHNGYAQSIKDIYLYPLHRAAKQYLCGGPQR